jgi:N-acetylgalactosamine kinase
MKGLLKIKVWKSLIEDRQSLLHQRLEEMHGGEAGLIAESARLMKGALAAYERSFGKDEVFIIRSPARINLMGMHIDHRGGAINPIAIKEMVVVVGPRSDDQVFLSNINVKEFPERKFRISRELPDEKIEDWEEWTRKETTRREKGGLGGDWSNYAKAAVLYLQNLQKERDGRPKKKICGMNLAVSSNIPIAGGLSSSSALVVASILAAMNVNDIEISRAELTEHCGTAEWFVGTRGGMGDHAAILFSEFGSVLHIEFFPLKVEVLPFPKAYSIILANSLVEAKKQVGAKNIFNNRVASYIIGRLLVKKNFPEYAPKITLLRDINPQNLGISEREMYEIILSLPEQVTRDEALRLLPGEQSELAKCFETHEEPAQGYKVRQVVAYGISECLRSHMAADFLRRGDVEGFGELINISHDGDRVTGLKGTERVKLDKSISAEKIRSLTRDSASDQPERRERAKLLRQPGGFDVSTPELDELVDTARRTDGVAGAGLVGAGLGGCIVVVVKKEEAQAVMRALEGRYYKPRGLPLAAEVVIPVASAAVIEI